MTETGPPLNENLKPVAWLIGKWKSEQANGKYPTIQDFVYEEELEFMHVGQPNLQYSAYARNSKTGKPMHREVGFLKIKPGTCEVALIVSANVGTSEVEEGVVDGQTMTLESHTFGRVSFNKQPSTQKLRRKFSLNGDRLSQVVEMETDKTPMTQHLEVIYKKVG